MPATPITKPSSGETLLGTEPQLLQQVDPGWRRRLNLFTGRALTVKPLQGEQHYRSSLLTTLAQSVTPGTVSGLDLRLDLSAPDPLIVVSPGYGIAASGEDVVLNTTLKTPLSTVGVIDLLALDQNVTLTQYHLGAKPSFAGILLLQPVIAQVSGENLDNGTGPTILSGNLGASCSLDPSLYAFEDLQMADAVRLVYLPWPSGVVGFPLPDFAPEATLRNRFAYAIFNAEALLGPDDQLPWAMLGVPLAVVAFDSSQAWKPLFVDRSSVVRAGGLPRRRVVIPSAPPPLRQWAPLTPFAAGQFLVDSNANVQTTKTAGTSAAPPPMWASDFGATTADGNLTWTNNGPARWQPKTDFAAGQFLYDSANSLQHVFVAGTSGATEPDWNAVYLPTQDGTVTWVNNGSGAPPLLQPAAAQARIRQLSEQLGETLATGQPFTNLSDIATTLPPSGLLPSEAVNFASKSAPWLPKNWSVSAAPVLIEELEAVLTNGITLAPLSTNPTDIEPVELLVPLPDRLYDPNILVTETVAPLFQQEVDKATAARNLSLQQIKTAHVEINALTSAIGPNQPVNRLRISVDSGLTRAEILGRNTPPPYTPSTDEAFETALPTTWLPAAAYVVGDIIVDANGALQVCTVAPAHVVSGTQAPVWSTTVATTTVDGAVTWLNNGPWAWQPNTAYIVGQFIVDSRGIRHTVTDPGTSGDTAPAWIDAVLRRAAGPAIARPTLDGVVWEAHGKELWRTDTPYTAGQLIFDVAGNIQQVQTAGISSDNVPSWNPNAGQATVDSAIVWRNLGHSGWGADTLFSQGQAIVDPTGNIQLVKVGGTTGDSAPAFAEDLSASTTDASISWSFSGTMQWAANTAYKLNQMILDPNGNLQLSQQAATSGQFAPVFSTVPGAITTDFNRADSPKKPTTLSWLCFTPQTVEIQQLKTIAGQAPYVSSFKDAANVDHPISLLGTDDLKLLDANGISALINDLNRRIHRANDLLDTGFLTAQTDIYRFRQNVLGATAASTLATSPILANIATGRTANATAENLQTYLSSLAGASTNTAGNDATANAGNNTTVKPVNYLPIKTFTPIKTGISTLFTEPKFHIEDFQTPRKSLRTEMVTKAVIGEKLSASQTAAAPDALAFTRFSVDTGTAQNFRAIISGSEASHVAQTLSNEVVTARPVSGVQQFINPGVNFTAATSDITSQSPLPGAQLNLRTLTIAERLKQSPSQEAIFYGIANRTSFLNTLQAIEKDLNLVVGDLPISIDDLDKITEKDPAVPTLLRTFHDWKFDVVPPNAVANRSVRSVIQSPALSTDSSEATLFSVGIRVIEQHSQMLRALEARIKQYADFVTLCTNTVIAMQGSIASARTYISNISNKLTQERQNVAFTSALLADEQKRVATVNQQRQTILAESVSLVAYTRARTIEPHTTAPSRQLVPANISSPVPACLSQTVAVPPELREIVAQLREAPIAWFPAAATLMEKLERSTVLLHLAVAAQARAVQQLQQAELPSSSARQPGAYARTISDVYEGNRRVFRSYVQERAYFRPADIANLAYKSQLVSLTHTAALNDLLAAEAVHTEVSHAVALLMQQISSVATCLYTRVSATLPIDRLNWAEFLRGPGATVPLSSLANLPGFSALDYIDRQQMQLLADWLFHQVDLDFPAAPAFMSDVIRTAILLASDVPLDHIIPSSILSRTQPTIGGTLALDFTSDRIAAGMIANLYSEGQLAARAVVSNHDGRTVTATITDVFFEGKFLESTDVAHFTAQKPYAVAVKAFDRE